VATSDRETIRITGRQGGHVGSVSVMHVGEDDDGLPVYRYWIFDKALAVIDEGRVLGSRAVSG
jgi:hypothetical protein